MLSIFAIKLTKTLWDRGGSRGWGQRSPHSPFSHLHTHIDAYIQCVYTYTSGTALKLVVTQTAYDTPRYV